MSAQMPELGSKITLISKADIRYEGRLYTVDPQECTIALAGVRSFGTEDRETQYPVPAQSQVYDYILFRGSDIKDIKMVTTQIPNDPAIVQLVPPTINQQPGYQTQAFNHPVMGSSLSQYPGYGGMGGIPSGNLGLQRAPGPLLMQPSELGASAPEEPQSDGPPPSLQPSNVSLGPLTIDKEQDLIGGVSRSTTPSVTRKSPTNDQGTQVNNSPARDDHKKPRPIQPPQRDRDGSRRDQVYQGQGFQRDKDYQGGNKKDYQPRDRGDYQTRDNYQYQRRGRTRDNQQRDDRDQRDHQMGDNFQNQNRQGGGLRNQRGNMRQGGSRSRGPPKHFNRPGGPATKKTTLKFDGDYDFDKANTEFEELRSQLGKVKISNGGKVNGEADKKDDSGNETGAGENEQEEEISIPEPCYDKSKSFFDTISCEAVERSKGRSQRTDWRTERKLNSETFGVAATRRGGFRGRGYYGGRGYNRPQGFRPRGPPRTDKTNNPIEGKQQQPQTQSQTQQQPQPQQQPQQQQTTTEEANGL